MDIVIETVLAGSVPVWVLFCKQGFLQQQVSARSSVNYNILYAGDW